MLYYTTLEYVKIPTMFLNWKFEEIIYYTTLEFVKDAHNVFEI